MKDELIKDFWIHVGGFVAIGIGLVDLWVYSSHLGETADLMFIIGGIAALGVKLVNGTAAAVGAAATAAAVGAIQQASSVATNASAVKAAALAAASNPTVVHAVPDAATLVSPSQGPASGATQNPTAGG